jgi:hypothetical protein
MRAAFACALLLGGWTDPGTWVFERPFDGQVYRYTCHDLANSIVAVRVRIRSLEDLIFQSGRVPVGPIVALIDYLPDLRRAHADQDAMLAAAASHGCPIPPSPDRVRAYRPR